MTKRNKTIVVAADIHYCKSWDQIDTIIPDKVAFRNPNKIFRDFVNDFNTKNLLILNGDIVDYMFTDYFFETLQSNWKPVVELLKEKKINFYMNRGNHDYREWPYNYNFYTLKLVNISDKIRKKYRKQIGHHKFRLFKELKSILIDEELFDQRCPIHYRYKEIEIDNKLIILLDTGKDAFVDKKSYTQWKLVKEIMHFSVDSEGLDDTQINKLKYALKKTNKKEIFILTHNPMLFFNYKKMPKLYIDRNNYQKWIDKNKLNDSIFIQNNEQFLNTLLESDKNITVISGHLHIPLQYYIDKKEEYLKKCSLSKINKIRNDKNKIKFVVTLPFGVLANDNNNKKLGYLTISDEGIYEHEFEFR